MALQPKSSTVIYSGSVTIVVNHYTAIATALKLGAYLKNRERPAVFFARPEPEYLRTDPGEF